MHPDMSSMDSFEQGILQIELFKHKKHADSAAHKRCRLSDNIGYERKKHAITCSKLAVSIEVCTNLHLQSGSQIPLGNQTCQGKIQTCISIYFPQFKLLFWGDVPIFSHSNHYFWRMFSHIFCIQTTPISGLPRRTVSGAVSQVGGHGETCSAAIQNGGGGCTGAAIETHHVSLENHL